MVPITVFFPEAVKAQGAVSVTVVPVASIPNTAAPSLAALNTDGVNISLFLITGAAAPTSTTTTGEAPRRLGSRNVTQESGNTNHAIGDLQYVYDPQAPLSDPVNAARELLVPGEEFFAVYRYGPQGDEPLAADDIVDIWRIETGPQNKGATGDGEFDQLTITQTAVAKAPPVEDVALVA